MASDHLLGTLLLVTNKAGVVLRLPGLGMARGAVIHFHLQTAAPQIHVPGITGDPVFLVLGQGGHFTVIAVAFFARKTAVLGMSDMGEVDAVGLARVDPPLGLGTIRIQDLDRPKSKPVPYKDQRQDQTNP